MGDPFSYQGKRVVVTGAASGVGAALVELLDELGAAHVTAIDRDTPAGPTHRFIEADLSTEAGVEAAAAAVDGPVHVLFANAGVAATQPTRTVLSVNFLATRRLSQRLAARMTAGAAIVLTSSMAGTGWPSHRDDLLKLMAIDDWDESLAWFDCHPELTADPYGLSKECGQLYTLYASRTLGRSGIRITGACPNPISTPLLADFRATMTDELLDWAVRQGHQGRPATAREVAQVLAFLGSDAAAYLNGVNIPVDAGMQAALLTDQTD
ncbi:coniferyl-alcohol dehydrogenase [Pseudofrankia sp. BMG5.37]|uniref:coniferyl-alcohol dehydrogenase n=1 Tax=Pseudofrankia sp. BMG5.37 TaxID=3050035 RepID=UPI0028948229|nr:coniferyl-alcohol dehydrogenase [Pseudofrankia sp. BMG5.37]MDT3439418.1 coniferyl-alcohol dehydrogenase [Pseudofrankia sp. BMG5.37]